MKYISQTAAPRALAAALALTLGGAMVQAHPGHGLHDASAAHILTSPYHLAILAASGAALLLAARLIQRRLPRRLVQVAGFAALAAVAVLWAWRG